MSEVRAAFGRIVGTASEMEGSWSQEDRAAFEVDVTLVHDALEIVTSSVDAEPVAEPVAESVATGGEPVAWMLERKIGQGGEYEPVSAHLYRDLASMKAAAFQATEYARIRPLGYLDALEAILRELADDLEAELRARYGADHADGIHPAMQPKFDRDMEPVLRARAALNRGTGGGAS